MIPYSWVVFQKHFTWGQRYSCEEAAYRIDAVDCAFYREDISSIAL